MAGSIGPTGQVLEPYGDLPAAEARRAFAEQAAALARGGADLLILETFYDLEEIALALAAAVQTGLPVVAGMAFDPSGRTSFGVSPQQAAARLSASAPLR